MNLLAHKAAHIAAVTLNNPFGIGTLMLLKVIIQQELIKILILMMKIPFLEEGDIIIDHSTSDITKCQELEKYCSKLGISYIFSGVYGAPYAIGACSKIFQSLSPGNVKC